MLNHTHTQHHQQQQQQQQQQELQNRTSSAKVEEHSQLKALNELNWQSAVSQSNVIIR